MLSVFKLFSFFYSQKTKLSPNLDNHVKYALFKATIWHHSPWSLFSFWGSPSPMFMLSFKNQKQNNDAPHKKWDVTVWAQLHRHFF